MKSKKPDIINKHTSGSWVYTPEVKQHFFSPQNLLLEDPKDAKYDGVGLVGSPACGDVMRVWLKIDKKNDRIKEFKWRTFGCASAIASTSMLSIMVTEKQNGKKNTKNKNVKGMKIDDALKIKPQDIIKRLGGLPDRKIHCSVLGDKALRAALNDWFKKSRQYDRIVLDGNQIIDPDTKVTERDIEEAVLEGASTLAQVQQRTKVAISHPDLIPKVEQLIRFYREKYFGK